MRSMIGIAVAALLASLTTPVFAATMMCGTTMSDGQRMDQASQNQKMAAMMKGKPKGSKATAMCGDNCPCMGGSGQCACMSGTNQPMPQK